MAAGAVVQVRRGKLLTRRVPRARLDDAALRDQVERPAERGRGHARAAVVAERESDIRS